MKKRKKNMGFIRMAFLVIGILGMIWMLLPLLLRGILNIGNLSGIAVSGLMILYALFAPSFHRFLKQLRRHLPGQILSDLMAAGLLLILVLVAVETGLMVKAASNTPSETGGTVVILGCKVKGNNPSRMLRERLEAACTYLKENPESSCVLSGGQGPDEIMTEAECMYRYLTAHGIDENRLYKEEKSTSTRENLAFSKEIIEANQLNPRIVIATNEFHEYRAGKIAQSLNLRYSAVPGRTTWWLFGAYYVRELYGILYQWVF